MAQPAGCFFHPCPAFPGGSAAVWAVTKELSLSKGVLCWSRWNPARTEAIPVTQPRESALPRSRAGCVLDSNILHFWPCSKEKEAGLFFCCHEKDLSRAAGKNLCDFQADISDSGLNLGAWLLWQTPSPCSLGDVFKVGSSLKSGDFSPKIVLLARAPLQLRDLCPAGCRCCPRRQSQSCPQTQDAGGYFWRG